MPTLRLVRNADRERRRALARLRRRRHVQDRDAGFGVLGVRTHLNRFSEALLLSGRAGDAAQLADRKVLAAEAASIIEYFAQGDTAIG
jgi:hypothetical protein